MSCTLFIVGIVCMFVGVVLALLGAALGSRHATRRHGEDHGVVDLGEWKPSQDNQVAEQTKLPSRESPLGRKIASLYPPSSDQK